jgi:hypothetical protein
MSRSIPTVSRLHRRYLWLEMPPDVTKMFERKYEDDSELQVDS